MFRGIATVSFYADDLVEAARWYSELLTIQPYYAYPPPPTPAAYIEFRVGDDEDELGIINRKYAPTGASNVPGGAVTFWHVDDLPEMISRLTTMGATQYEPLTEREAGFATASFIDPFGNLLGIMHNPHYLEISARRNPL